MCLMEVGGRGCYGAQEKLVAARCPRRKETSASQRHSAKGKLAMFKVRSKYLLLIAAAVWLIAGSQVARMGIEAIAAGNGNLWLLLIGIPATFGVFHMMFSKLVGKHAARIRSYGEEKMHVLKFFDVRGYLIMAVMMGGGIAPGNWTPAAEFSMGVDPEAAQIVFKSGVPLVMCGLDVTMQAELRPADWDEMAGYGNRCGSLVRELFACAWSAVQTVGLTGVAQHDSCPVLYLAHPELFEGKMAGVFVETQAELTLGKTVTDLQSDKKFEQKNALVLLKLDREAFMQLLKDCIRTLP